MRDKGDMRGARAMDVRGLRGFCLKSLLTLMTLLTLFIANAQALQRPNGLLNRLQQRQGAAAGQRPSAAQQPNDPAAAPGAAGAADAGGRSIEFNAAPVDMVFTVYQDLVGKTVLKDPQTPQATITLQPKKGQELSDQDKIEAIETVLEMNGIHIEPYGEKFVRALPRKDARKDGIPLFMDPNAAELKESTRVVSVMIHFDNIAIDEAQKALEGFKSNSGILLVFERTNSILATDTSQIIKRMLEIAKAIDIASPVTETVEYIQIKYANATEVKQVIDNIVQESMKEQEKNGKAPVNSPGATPEPVRPLLGGLRRPGQAQQPNTPVNQASLVTTVSDADRGMIRGKVVTIADERSNKILIITNAQNMKFFKEVIAALDVETTPDVQVKVYRLKYAEAEDVSDMINDLIGNSASSKNSGKANQNQNAAQGTSGSLTRSTTSPTTVRKPANQRTGEAKAGELNKDNVTVLADKRINGLVVMARTEDIPTLEQIIESMDIKLSQVLIETAIIEVTLGDDLNTGVNWARMGDKREVKTMTPSVGAHGLQNHWYRNDAGELMIHENVGEQYTESKEDEDDVTWTRIGKDGEGIFNVASDWVRTGFMGSNGKIQSMLGGGGASETAAGILNTLVGVGTNTIDNISPAGSGLNWFFKSDSLNIAAIIQASKTDSRSKYIASPVVMTLDNKEAVINATEMSYLLKGFQSSGNSYSTIAVPDYEQKELGIEIKVTPKINPNGTVMLTVETKYTQIGADQKIKYSAGSGEKAHLEEVGVPTTITREMSSDVLLENMQSVVFGGLTQNFKKTTETGIPILKDIPIIGKWLFGSVSESEKRTELLVFMTPYVLDEGAAAQAEALRRKKTMSDPRPWEDNGWSLSPLADPVAKKEQMRRIKEEWKKQDEERKTKIAIEKMKVDRAKKLQEMSKEERDLWLKMHKEELEDEAQDELEEKMLDEKSQEELKKLAAEVRAKKLGEAEKEIKAAADEAAAENERGKLDAEKKVKTEGEAVKGQE